MMQILTSLNAFKLVKNIISNFLYSFSWQFIKVLPSTVYLDDLQYS